MARNGILKNKTTSTGWASGLLSLRLTSHPGSGGRFVLHTSGSGLPWSRLFCARRRNHPVAHGRDADFRFVSEYVEAVDALYLLIVQNANEWNSFSCLAIYRDHERDVSLMVVTPYYKDNCFFGG